MRERLVQVWHHDTTCQFVRYAVVGCLNAGLFLVVFNVLTPGHASRRRTIIGDGVAFLVTNVISFFLNKVWSFRDTRRNRLGLQYGRFLFFTLMGLGLQLGAFSLALIPLEQFGRLGRNLAAVSTTPISVAWNFTAYRKWTFNVTSSQPKKDAF